MQIIRHPAEMTAWAKEQAKAGHRIGLVPTMGFFHEGHLSLMRRAGQLADFVAVSLFVNPTQFGPQEDLAAYPRNFERDCAMVEAAGVSVLFAPIAAEMYPAGFSTTVAVGAELTGQLCGASRPGHFAGVATVVCKLFNIVQPDVAVFGQKDFQQLAVIRRMTADLNLGVEIVAHPIVREADGLAMSSRNTYLLPQQRESALSLSRALALARTIAAEGERSTERLTTVLRDFIHSFPETEVDYISFVHQDTLQQVAEIDEKTVIALAVKIGGRVRLIDNGLVL
ncbi:MAG: pantothenate synthetase [Candidatus Electronema aureum]|uniref:Pantothenate synthetase n=1 Tax=Candidatus Electronema aureum TaxID=2005002 RepID=A0A521FZI1_9BACT|nr:MAG: pantothenate synthetase [Candidatus Electronema aureum]